jgi:hypothetical protein
MLNKILLWLTSWYMPKPQDVVGVVAPVKKQVVRKTTTVAKKAPVNITAQKAASKAKKASK